MNILRLLLILFIVLINTSVGYSQVNNIKKSDRIETLDGKKFYIHKVEKGQTVYSICKLYEISQDELNKFNPEATNELKLEQELKIPVKEKITETNSYTYYTVNKNETAYSIAKKNNITVNELFALNPDAKEGLQVGQKLKIKEIKKPIDTNANEIKPIIKIEETKEQVSVSKDHDYIKHKVKKKETLYSISKLYGVSTDDILNANTNVKENGLKKGEIINIPSKDFLAEISKAIAPPDTLLVNDSILTDSIDCFISQEYDKKRVIRIGLLLPFELDIKTLNIELEKTENIHNTDLPKTKPFFEFYQGLLLSLKEFKKNDISFDLYVYNTKKDVNIAKSIILKPEIKQLDFIIGPIYKDVFDTVLKYIPQGIALINPLIDVSNANYASNIVIQNKSSREITHTEVVKYVSGFENANYIIIHNGTKKELELITEYKHLLNSSLSNVGDSIYVKIINFNDGKLKAIKPAINKKRTNIVLIPSTEQGFVTNVITNLHVASVEDSIILIGMEEWLKYNIEVKYLHSLNLTVFKNRYIDYKDQKVLNFQKEFIDEYSGIPSIYSFVGYDSFNYYVNAFMHLNDNFSYCIDKFEAKGLSKSFGFEKIENHFINKSLYKIQYKKDLSIELID